MGLLLGVGPQQEQWNLNPLACSLDFLATALRSSAKMLHQKEWNNLSQTEVSALKLIALSVFLIMMGTYEGVAAYSERQRL